MTGHVHAWILTYEVQGTSMKGYHCLCGASKLVEGVNDVSTNS